MAISNKTLENYQQPLLKPGEMHEMIYCKINAEFLKRSSLTWCGMSISNKVIGEE